MIKFTALRKCRAIFVYLLLQVGGGPVGVELAAELVEAFPCKKVTLVDGSEQLCPAFAQASRTYVYTSPTCVVRRG